MKKITLDTIDTTEAEKNFVNRLSHNKTYFLNGEWGSGKTTFLENSKKYSKKKFIYLDIWNTKDSRNLMEIAYSKLHHHMYFLFKFLVVSLIAVSVLASPVINLGIEKFLNLKGYNIVVKIGVIVSLFVTMWQILKYKSDSFYSRLISKFLRKKVLIIDDFDRASKKRQEDSYKLFNILNGKLPIVFVGDFTKIVQNEENFLQKIIDSKIELPFALHPRQIWNSYFKQLATTFNVKIPENLKMIFVKERRNLRDRERFNSYVVQEFFERGKFEHVQTVQQLAIIYVYLYYPKAYQQLLETTEISTFSDNEYINKTLQVLLQDNSDYPRAFKRNTKIYFLYENASNLTAKEAKTIVNEILNEGKKKEFIDSDINSDFYQYFTSNYNNLAKEQRDKFFQLAINYAKKIKYTPIVRYIFNSKDIEIDANHKKDRYESWMNELENYELDESEKIYLLQNFTDFSFEEQAKWHDTIGLDEQILKTLKLESYYILLYLVQKGLWGNFKAWQEDFWNIVNSMNDKNFLAFWIMQGIIDNHLNYAGAPLIPKDKKYTLVITQKSDGFFKGKAEEREFAIKHIKSKINELENKGYTFEYFKG